MLIETFTAGPAETNGYLVADRPGGSALVIDAPLGTAAAMVRQATDWGAALAVLVNTHGHWDHVLDNAALLQPTRVRFGIHRDSAALLTLPQPRWFGLDLEMPACAPDFFLEEGTPLTVGTLQFEVLECPGHCPGSVALYARAAGVVFTGDVLFAGTVGRTDLPGGDPDTLHNSIIAKLLPLGDDVRVYAGHGSPTTIGAERQHNPFLA
ncbi:MBL fold metallo-hydrolase [bacterium]|nr:MBL fold metallo-hydrolase [bacterium]